MRRERALLAEILQKAVPPGAKKRLYSVDLIAKRWESVVGEELARRSEPEALNHGVLTVRVTDAAWGRMIAKLQGRIIPAVNRAVGTNLVKRINFTKRERLEGQGEHAPVRERKPLPVPPESVVRASESIADPELRELVTRSAARYLRAQEERRRK